MRDHRALRRGADAPGTRLSPQSSTSDGTDSSELAAPGEFVKQVRAGSLLDTIAYLTADLPSTLELRPRRLGIPNRNLDTRLQTQAYRLAPAIARLLC